MPNEVVVVTTKPAENQAEYAIRDTVTGEFVRHGVLIPVSIGSLPPTDQAKLAAARDVMLQVATEHAESQGYI